jgi:hypothetical protein
MTKYLVIAFSDLLLRVQRVSMTRECAYRQAGIVYCFAILTCPVSISEHALDVDV